MGISCKFFFFVAKIFESYFTQIFKVERFVYNMSINSSTKGLFLVKGGGGREGNKMISLILRGIVDDLLFSSYVPT